MKDKNLGKINTLGRIGQYITNVLKVFTLISILMALIGVAVIYKMPKGQIGMSIDIAVLFHVKNEGLGALIIEDALDRMDAEADFELLGMDLHSSKVYEEDGKTKVVYETDTNEFDFSDLQLYMILYVLEPISIFAALWLLGDFCKKIRYCKTPFTKEIFVTVQRFIISMVITCIISLLADGIVNWLWLGKFSLDFEVDTLMIIVLLFLLCLVKIFHYGTVVQIGTDHQL